MSLSSLAAQCGPDVHPATTTAIIRVESGGHPYAIHDNTTGKTYKPGSKTEARWLAYRLLMQGHSIDMGLMQVNSQHIWDMNIDYQNLFDACYNIRTGTQILAGFYRKYHRPGARPETTLLLALSGYNTGTPYSGRAYINCILVAAGSSVRVAVINYRPSKAALKGRAGSQNTTQTTPSRTPYWPSGRSIIALSQERERAP